MVRVHMSEIKYLTQLPAIARYACFDCGRVVDGDDTFWLRDESGLGYPFCCVECRDKPWPLSEPFDGEHLRLWNDSALIIQWNPS